nr:glyoxylate/hydroxypyruvate reductase HPR3-like [Tanacetum cinerariifolium]
FFLIAEMDLFSLIRAPNPIKVKTGSRPPVATDSSSVPSAIERSPLDFADEAEASGRETAAPEMPPPEEVPITTAPGTDRAVEAVVAEPLAVRESRKRGPKGVDANAPPKLRGMDSPIDESDLGSLSHRRTSLEVEREGNRKGSPSLCLLLTAFLVRTSRIMKKGVKSCHQTREAMGCIISYTSRQQKHSLPFTFYPNVHQLASNSDALVLCCALTDDTHHIINKRVIRALGKNGVIVNVARGSVIDEVELVKCLVNGEIGGIGLDVFENEPSVPKELFGFNNVVMLPHSTAYTWECSYNAAQVIASNIEAFFTNRPYKQLLAT